MKLISERLLIILVSFLSSLGVVAQNSMIIGYQNGKQQVVKLDQPSCNIQSVSFGSPGNSDEGKEYTDNQGNKVYLPCGKLAFADKVVTNSFGSPVPSDPKSKNTSSALGEPDYTNNNQNSTLSVYAHLTLGCGGSVVLEFTAVRLVDIEGPDLYVFECGPAVEPTQLEISKDGKNWVNIGRISGGKASVDISSFVAPGDQFRFVKLTDLKSNCSGATPGADIDAVAFIGCVKVQK
jgi:OmpA-OmpF porin, OOP family